MVVKESVRRVDYAMDFLAPDFELNRDSASIGSYLAGPARSASPGMVTTASARLPGASIASSIAAFADGSSRQPSRSE
jgi:hypothetical protein